MPPCGPSPEGQRPGPTVGFLTSVPPTLCLILPAFPPSLFPLNFRSFPCASGGTSFFSLMRRLRLQQDRRHGVPPNS
jgi:hypothetical protein